MSKDKIKALEAAISQIEKNFGKGSIMKLGSTDVSEGIQGIPTGSLTLDLATGIGGFPRGRVIEIYGIDAEHALDINYASRLGVNIEDLLVSQPDTGEQALEVAETLVRSGAVDIIVIDSVAALVPKAEIEGEMGDSLPGLHARLMSQAMRKLTAAISKSHTTIIFINQIRMKIGVMFGNPETTTGGNALKFYSSMRLDIRRIENLKNGQEIIGSRVRVKVVKNKVAPPFQQAEFDIFYNEGISKTGEIVDLGVAKGFIDKAGAWYSYNNSKIGQGRDNVKEYLKQHPDIAVEIEEKIIEDFRSKRAN